MYIAAATFFWGVSATMGRAAFTGRLLLHGQAIGSIDPLILSQSRTTLSALFLFPFLLASRGGRGLRVTRTDLVRMTMLGVFGLAAANYFYYLAIQKTNVATAIIVQYTAPVWVLLYAFMQGSRRPTGRTMTAVILSVVGIAVAIGPPGSDSAHLYSLGIGAALLAAFSCAFYNISGHKVMVSHDHWTVVLYMMGSASVLWLAINPPWKIIAQHYSSVQWLFLAVFALCSMLIPFSFYFAGLKYLEPTRAIVTSCLEPIFAILIAAAILGETVRIWQILGMFMVLAAILLIQQKDMASEESIP